MGARLRSLAIELRASPFVRHNAVFFVGSLGVATLNYLYYPALSRLLDATDFGEVQTLISLFAQLAILLNILTYVTIHITISEPNETKRTKSLLGLENAVLIVSGILLTLSLLLVGSLRSFLHFTSGWPFVALILAIAVSLPLVVRMAYLRGRKQFVRASLTDGIGSVAKLLLSAMLVIIGLYPIL